MMLTVSDEYNKDFVEYLFSTVFIHYGADCEYIYAKSKRRDVSTAKHMSWYLLHYNYDYSINLISKISGVSPRGVRKGVANMSFFIKNLKTFTNDYDNIVKKIDW